jgi:hypothetical protein
MIDVRIVKVSDGLENICYKPSQALEGEVLHQLTLSLDVTLFEFGWAVPLILKVDRHVKCMTTAGIKAAAVERDIRNEAPNP